MTRATTVFKSSPVFGRMKLEDFSDHSSLKLVDRAEIQI
jgi:hypothetical protein